MRHSCLRPRTLIQPPQPTNPPNLELRAICFIKLEFRRVALDMSSFRSDLQWNAFCGHLARFLPRATPSQDRTQFCLAAKSEPARSWIPWYMSKGYIMLYIHLNAVDNTLPTIYLPHSQLIHFCLHIFTFFLNHTQHASTMTAKASVEPVVRPSTASYGNVAQFKYTPLDHNKRSIRLVRILPSRSPRDPIQCTISHDTVDAKYACLSYRWGTDEPEHIILVDGKAFAVRLNLLDFLTVARERALGDPSCLGPFWIDAISINQANILERNHQVAQMGQIFSKAAHVYLWLGRMPSSLVPLLNTILGRDVSRAQNYEAVAQNRDMLVKHVFDNEYWRRAWVTQEIALAKGITVWSDRVSCGFKEMVDGWEYFSTIPTRDEKLSFRDGGGSHPQTDLQMAFFRSARHWHEKSPSDRLVVLLEQFHDKQCKEPLDRIFSLLSLCSDEGRNLAVDYKISNMDLAARVLRQCEGSLCLCSTILVLQALGIGDYEVPDLKANARHGPYLEFDVVADLLTPNATSRHIYSHFPYTRKPGAVSNDHSEQKTGQYFHFHDTCTSGSLDYFQISWDSQGGNVNSTHSVQPSGQWSDHSGPYGDAIKLVKCEENLFTVCVPLWLLAKMVKTPVELCSNARTQRTRPEGVRIRSPHVAYRWEEATHNKRNLPPTRPKDTSTSLLAPRDVEKKREVFLNDIRTTLTQRHR